MRGALGISPHTGWAACVVVRGTPARPQIVANQVIQLLETDAERFCYHVAADLKRAAAAPWLAKMRAKALANARRALAPLLTADVTGCAIVARDGYPGELDAILAAHPRIHTAEGCFYRDVLREACGARVTLVPPKALDPAAAPKVAIRPWGRDQKLAALAAWSCLRA